MSSPTSEHKTHQENPTISRGLSVIELLVVIAIISILFSLSAVGLMQARETGRSAKCLSNQRNLAQALLHYESTFRFLPIGAHKDDMPSNQLFGVIPRILPLLDQNADSSKINWNISPIDPKNSQLYEIGVSAVTRCPSDDLASRNSQSISYAVNAGSDAAMTNPDLGLANLLGAFDLGNYVATSDFADGASNTTLLAERLVGNQPANTSSATRRDSQGTPPRDFADIPMTFIPHGQPNRFATECSKVTNAHEGWITSLGRNWVTCHHFVHVLPPNSSILDCGFNSTYPLAGVISARSNHSGSITAAFGDGRVEFISDAVDINLWRSLGTRSGNETEINR